MSEYRHGNRVLVGAFEGTVTNDLSYSTWVMDDKGKVHEIRKGGSVRVTDLGPPDFPVRSGDVWQRGNQIYFGSQTLGVGIVLLQGNGHRLQEPEKLPGLKLLIRNGKILKEPF